MCATPYPPDRQQSASGLRIASYNLQKCIGMDMRRRPGRSLKVIDAIGAEIVVLQEADKRLPPRPAALPHDRLERHGWHILPFGQPGGSLGWHGNAMLMRPGVELVRQSHLELPGLEPRGAVLAEFLTPLGPLRVIGAHLGLLQRFRLLQVAAIRKAIRDLPQIPTVLAGDFNEWGSVAPLENAADGFTFYDPGASFPALRPIGHLDRFAVTGGLHVAECGVFDQRPAQVASDHRPVWIDLQKA